VVAIVLTILNTILAVFSTAGNAIVLIAIWRTSSLHSTSNYFIASLAAADLSVGFIINPLWVAKSGLNIWENNHFLTIFTEFMSVQTLVTTTFNLAAVSVDRYVAVTNVFRYLEIVTKKRCIILITFIWIFSLAFSALRFTISDPLLLPYLWIAVSVICYTIPFTIIAYCYYKIFKVAKRQSRQIEMTENSVGGTTRSNEEAIKRAKKNRKAAYTIGIIIGLYLVFALPSMIISAIQLLTPDECLKLKIIRAWFWGALVSFSSSAFNPWIYAARNTEYRRAFQQVL
ncbi:predicted protein, partial [Nematostella vectensis]